MIALVEIRSDGSVEYLRRTSPPPQGLQREQRANKGSAIRSLAERDLVRHKRIGEGRHYFIAPPDFPIVVSADSNMLGTSRSENPAKKHHTTSNASAVFGYTDCISNPPR